MLFMGAVSLQQIYEPASALYNWQEAWQGGAGLLHEPYTYEQDATWADNSPVHGPLPPMFTYEGPAPEEYEYEPMTQLPDLPVQQPSAPGNPYGYNGGELPEGGIAHSSEGSPGSSMMPPEEKSLFEQYISILTSGNVSPAFRGQTRRPCAATQKWRAPTFLNLSV